MIKTIPEMANGISVLTNGELGFENFSDDSGFFVNIITTFIDPDPVFWTLKL